uniref:Uncharacterized protein n=1 Tax=Pectobacterium carotovorum TaxID=554 RepID=A0A0K0MPI3_PECCA|nr:hypothetical protein [Pectobacterium carotovorum]AKG47518.1 hypothetical protein pA_00078 [Pectobacterium carotovorum]
MTHNKTKKEIIIEQITKDLGTDLDKLDSVWTNHPILLIRYGAKQAEADRLLSEDKSLIEGLESSLYSLVRAVRSMNGTKTSESSIEAMVKQIEQHYSGDITGFSLKTSFMEELPERAEIIAKTLSTTRKRYNETKELSDIYKSAVEALRHRRDMIVQASKKAILDYEILGAGSFAGKKS